MAQRRKRRFDLGHFRTHSVRTRLDRRRVRLHLRREIGHVAERCQQLHLVPRQPRPQVRSERFEPRRRVHDVGPRRVVEVDRVQQRLVPLHKQRHERQALPQPLHQRRVREERLDGLLVAEEAVEVADRDAQPRRRAPEPLVVVAAARLQESVTEAAERDDDDAPGKRVRVHVLDDARVELGLRHRRVRRQAVHRGVVLGGPAGHRRLAAARS
mmetsp:Transcript_21415/g.66436  ORF Transcript_21415/g.66436 Transcript_21415/m.66436 type:complete len:213 (+) Transcript_21415:274-912(+)